MFIKAEQRIAQYLKVLDAAKYRSVADLQWEVYATTDRLRTPPDAVTWAPIQLPHAYGAQWTSYWFRSTAVVPQEAAGHDLFLAASPNADSLVFLDREPIGALNPFHGKIRLAATAEPGRSLDLHLESYAGHYYPGMDPLRDRSVILTLGAHIADYPNVFGDAGLVVKNESVYALYYDALLLFDAARNLGPDSLRRHRIIRGLYNALSTIRFTATAEELSTQAEAARSAIAPLLATTPGDTVPTMHLVGHAHIDHAWLWPIWETERKAARTFANMARLAEEFEEFVFIQSQPAQLEIIEREYPAVFAAVKRAYQRGQWEPNGGMWVEADCNVPSGESLIRQFLVGKQASQRMLGYEGDTLWLPDVFGYAAALPQILAGCEIDYFVTSKINWNDTTRFPYDTFVWRGIDGTGVKTHFITTRNNGYNGRVNVDELWDAWHHLQHKDLHGQLVKPIGEGDGGGGTLRADLESARRLSALEGAPQVRWTRVSDALGKLFAEASELPEWRGELYLELHRGTYTTQARTKRYNRMLEFRLRELEALYTLLAAIAPAGAPPYPRQELTACWKMLLTNQFHDIIPGSSIRAVYEDAERWYREIEEQTESLIAGTGPAFAKLAGNNDLTHVALNTFSWERHTVIPVPVADDQPAPTRAELDGDSVPVQVARDVAGRTVARIAGKLPALAIRSLRLSADTQAATTQPEPPFSIQDEVLTTPFYRIEFDAAGRIMSLVDREHGTEFVTADAAFNSFVSAEDLPIKWDAWDIDADWERSAVQETRLQETPVVSIGPVFAQLRQRYAIGRASTLTQDIYVYATSRRIDFDTQVEWHEDHRLLKVAFPANVTTNQVRCEVQYGHLMRNTHANRPADQAQFEFAAQKWIAVEETGRGVALLNDCKYGHDVNGSTMRLTLLRSPKAPDPQADMGTHRFCYAILPFVGAFSVESVVRQAYDLNNPVSTIAVDAPAVGRRHSAAAAPGSLLQLDTAQVIVEALKPAEETQTDDQTETDLIVRLYEAGGGAVDCTLSSAYTLQAVHATNMLERDPHALQHTAHQVTLQFRPFEIKTLRLRIRRNKHSSS